MSALTSHQDWHMRELKRSLRIVNMRKHASALLLIAPLAIFIFLVFVAPVASMIARSVESPEVVDALPSTTAVLRHWDRGATVPDEAFRGLVIDIERNGGSNDSGKAAGRLNPALASEIAGTRISCRVRPFFRSPM